MQKQLYFLRNSHYNFGRSGSGVHSRAQTTSLKGSTIDCMSASPRYNDHLYLFYQQLNTGLCG